MIAICVNQYDTEELLSLYDGSAWVYLPNYYSILFFSEGVLAHLYLFILLAGVIPLFLFLVWLHCLQFGLGHKEAIQRHSSILQLRFRLSNICREYDQQMSE